MAEAARLRDAVPADLAAILAITNDAIAHTTAIWMTTPFTPAQRAAWFEARLAASLPVIVAEDAQGDVLGFGSYGPFRPYDGYALTVEHSVYVAASARGAGIGRRLLVELVNRATLQGFHMMIGAIAAENAASIALHRSEGFTAGPVLPEVGRKFDRWLDLLLMYRRLDAGLGPQPLPETLP